MHSTILARTQTTDAQIAGLHRYNLSENIPSPWQPVYCAAPGCAKRADVWLDLCTPVCGRHYLMAIGDEGEAER